MLPSQPIAWLHFGILKDSYCLFVRCRFRMKDMFRCSPRSTGAKWWRSQVGGEHGAARRADATAAPDAAAAPPDTYVVHADSVVALPAHLRRRAKAGADIEVKH